MIAAAEHGSHGSKLTALDLVPPRAKRVLRVLVPGAQPGTSSVKGELAAMGADEAITVDDLPAIVARARLKATPPDVVLVVGPLWTPGSATVPPVRTETGHAAGMYLRNGFPVRWLRGGLSGAIVTMPEPGDA